MKKVFYCIAFALFLLCSCKSYYYNDNRPFFLTTGKEKHISEVLPLSGSIGPRRDNRFGEAFERASEGAVFKADLVLRNECPQFYEKGKD